MKISLIVAMASNRTIGLDGKMPWHLPADLKHFKKITMGAPILMGRKTFESIGHALPGRTNLIISQNQTYQQPGCLVFANIDSALSHCQSHNSLFVIGGASLYASLLSRADFLYLTEIHKNFIGDTFFPVINPLNWEITTRNDIENDATVDFSYSFLTLKRIQSD